MYMYRYYEHTPNHSYIMDQLLGITITTVHHSVYNVHNMASILLGLNSSWILHMYPSGTFDPAIIHIDLWVYPGLWLISH